MLCALTVRRLRPGTFDEFRRAWEPDEWPPGFTRAYHLRNVRDENEVVSFGFFDGTREELERQLSEMDPDGSNRAERERRISEYVDEIGADSVFEVVEEVTPPGR